MCFLFQFMLNIFVDLSGFFNTSYFLNLKSQLICFYAVVNNLYTVILF